MMVYRLLASLFIVLLVQGCTSIKPLEKQYSGFLGNYSDMQKVEASDGSDVMRWITPTLKTGQYKKMIVEPVSFFPAPRTSDQVKLETLHEISDYMTASLKRELGREFEITDKSGPDTLHVQIAITGVETPIQGLQSYEVVPIALIYAGASTALGARDTVAVVYVEGMMTDSVTGELVAKGVRQGVAESLRDNKEQLDVDKVKKLLDGWAAEVNMLAKRLL
ncbi:DUF3313 domain-containing protein [Ketobacter sp.]|uniref:DUF3313 domain-containing protein n=1 Tax=Ketobacter sp. TaxID=2083498 RepID=UPI0025BBA000|nr:DUF3313 domain-containing protein [Ketobacter sp.]